MSMCTRSNARVDYYYKKEMAIISVLPSDKFQCVEDRSTYGEGRNSITNELQFY